MYKLAMTTATAGERFVPQDETLRVIKKTPVEGTVKLSEVRKFKEFDEVYREAKKAMRSVRHNTLNR